MAYRVKNLQRNLNKECLSGSIGFRSDTKAFFVQWYDPEKKKQLKIYRYKGEKIFSRKTANKLLSQMQNDVENGSFNLERFTGKFQTDTIIFIDEWFAAVKSELTPATLNGYRSYLKNHIRPFFEANQIALHEIKLDTLTKLLNSLKPAKGNGMLSGKHKFNIMSCFHVCLDFAWRSEKIIAVPPFPKKSVYQIQDPVIEWLPAERQIKTLECVPREHKPIFYFLKYHMRRPAEAMALHKSDYKDGVFTIRRSISGGVLLNKTKTGQYHIIPIHDDFEPFLNLAMKKPIISKFMFTCPSSLSEGKRYTSSILNRIWKKACKEAGETIDLYSGLKHSTVTQYAVEKGYSDSELQILTDHARVDSVKRYRKLEIATKKRLLMGDHVVDINKKVGR